MLHHNPRPTWLRVLRKTYFFFENPLKKRYYFLFRPKTTGVKAIVINNNRILLVRIGYGSRQWVIPGGMVDRGEDSMSAAKRELKEESGVVLMNMVNIGSSYSEREYKKDTVHYYFGTIDNEDLIIDDQEIIDAGWFAFDNLPDYRSDVVDAGIQLYNNWKYGKN